MLSSPTPHLSRHKKKKIRLALEATSSSSKDQARAPGAGNPPSAAGKGVAASGGLPWPEGPGKGGAARAGGLKGGRGGATKPVPQLSRAEQARVRAAVLEEERRSGPASLGLTDNCQVDMRGVRNKAVNFWEKKRPGLTSLVRLTQS